MSRHARSVNILITLTAVGILTFGPGAPALAATQGKVVVFDTETPVNPTLMGTKLDQYDNPQGCITLSAAAHVLDNLTDTPVKVYGSPGCMGPSLTIPPGYGSHVPPGKIGSFSA